MPGWGSMATTDYGTHAAHRHRPILNKEGRRRSGNWQATLLEDACSPVGALVDELTVQDKRW